MLKPPFLPSLKNFVAYDQSESIAKLRTLTKTNDILEC